MQQMSQNNHAKVYKRNKIFDFYESIIPDETNKSHNNFCKKKLIMQQNLIKTIKKVVNQSK